MRIDNDLSKFSILSLAVGSLSMFLWLIPIISIFTSLYTLYAGVKGIDSEKSDFSKIGICFGVMSFLLTLVRSAYVNGMIT